MAEAQNSTHTIRIHAAWQRVELTSSMNPIQTRAISLPDSQDFDPAACFLTYVRKFNAPSGLIASDIVELHCPMLIEAISAAFNGLSLPALTSATLDITNWLQKHNELTIQLPVSKVAVARTSTAQLLISSPAS